jgi:hypothetical protein
MLQNLIKGRAVVCQTETNISKSYLGKTLFKRQFFFLNNSEKIALKRLYWRVLYIIEIYKDYNINESSHFKLFLFIGCKCNALVWVENLN